MYLQNNVKVLGHWGLQANNNYKHFYVNFTTQNIHTKSDDVRFHNVFHKKYGKEHKFIVIGCQCHAPNKS